MTKISTIRKNSLYVVFIFLILFIWIIFLYFKKINTTNNFLNFYNNQIIDENNLRKSIDKNNSFDKNLLSKLQKSTENMILKWCDFLWKENLKNDCKNIFSEELSLLKEMEKWLNEDLKIKFIKNFWDLKNFENKLKKETNLKFE